MLSTGVGGLSAPPDGFSACYVALHMLTQCLSQLLGSVPVVISSTLNLLTSILKEFLTTLLPLDIL